MELIYILVTVCTIWGVAVVTPGPNFFLTAHTAVDDSRLSSFFVVLGITFGTLIWAVCGFMGINVLFKTVPVLFFTLKLLGGLYLIYLGLKLIFSKSSNGKSIKPAGSNLKSFKTGALTNLTNPKTAAFVTSLFATVMPADVSVGYGVVGIAAMCAISFLWYSSVAIVFSQNRFKSLYHRAEGAIRKTAGVIFVAFGARLAGSN